MDKSSFYQRLLVGLGRAKFNLSADPTKILDSTKWLPQPLLWSPIQFHNIEGAENAKHLDKEFDAIRPYSELVAFKFIVGSPMVACIIEGDERSTADLTLLAMTFKECIMRSTVYTPKPHGVVTGFLIFVFFDSAAEQNFVSSAQQNFRHRDTRTKTFVRPWVIDVTAKKVLPERTSWFDGLAALKPASLQKDLFSA
jgi:hypothetical protein